MIEKFLVGIMPTNCYVVYDEENKEALIVDPGDKSSELVQFIKEKELNVKYIYLTHCHFDHILGATWLKEETNAPICTLDKEEENIKDKEITMGNVILGKDIFLTPDFVLFENDEIQIGKLNFRVLHTPGHTSGSSSLYGNGILLSGDTLFKGTFGRCDLPTSNISNMMKSLKNKLFELPEDTIVYPGHGNSTTIGKEKMNEDF